MNIGKKIAIAGGCLFLLLPFQNCGKNWSATLDSASSSPQFSMEGSSEEVPVIVDALNPCLASSVGSPTLTFSQLTSVQALSGQGAKNGGSQNSQSLSVVYAASNAPANCQQTATVQCRMLAGNTITAMDASGARTPIQNNDITCRADSPNAAPGKTINISFQPKDNDTNKQCFRGTATFEISLRSSADTSKNSSSQTVTLNVKNNCYPEQVTTENPHAFDQMGTAVAIDGSTAAVLAPGDDGANGSNLNIGAVYIYQKSNANTWTKIQVLRTEDTGTVSDRGSSGDTPASLALKNDVLVIGSEFNNNKLGAAFVFRRSSGMFSQVGKVNGSVANGKFGRAVALDSAHLVVGAPGENSSAGAVYTFDLNNLNLLGKIGSPLGANCHFGAAVAVEGTLLAVGAPGSTLFRDTVTGDLVLYRGDGSSWAEIASNPLRSASGKENISAKDSAGNPGNLTIPLNSELGNSIAIYNGVVIVGAPGYSGGSKKPGLALIISADGSLQSLADFTNTDLGRYGTSVSLGSAGAFVGAPEVRTRGGAVDHYTVSNGSYILSRRIVSNTGADNDQFGFSVATSGNSFVVGAKLNADPNNASGSASLMTNIIP